MAVYCGTDIIEVARVKEAIENSEKFKYEVFTKAEIKDIDNISNENYKYQRYAGRFAAKEAIFKGVSSLLDDKFAISWKDAQVINDENGNPHVEFLNIEFKQIQSIDISISHCKEYAVATVVINIKEK